MDGQQIYKTGTLVESTMRRGYFQDNLHQPNAHWTLPQLMWIKENEPEVYNKTAKVFMVKDYVRYVLTGIWERIGWMHMERFYLTYRDGNGLKISVDLLGSTETFFRPFQHPQISLEKLPQKPDRFSIYLKEHRSLWDYRPGCRSAGSWSTQAWTRHHQTATAGNVAVVNREARPKKPDIYSYYHIIPEYWYVLTGTVCCAACYRWLRDLLCREEYRRLKVKV